MNFMRFFITLPFNIHTYRKILDKYWKGESDNNGSLGFYKKEDRNKKVRKFHKYFFNGRVPICCIDYDPPFKIPTPNFFTDWTPLLIDDMLVTFKAGESERLCSKYIFLVDELKDNEIITWYENGARMIGAFDSSTGNVSVAIKWELTYREQQLNKKYIKQNKLDKLILHEQPKLIINHDLKIDVPYDTIPVKVNWSLYSKDEGLRGIDFAVTIEKQILGDLIEKRIKTHKITLIRLIRKNKMDEAIKLGNWINKLSLVLEKCRNYEYRI